MDEQHNIENFFRHRMDAQQFSFREEDWSALENRMDAAGLSVPQEGKVMSTGKILFIILLTLTIAFFLGWFARDKFFGERTEEEIEQKSKTEEYQPVNASMTPVLPDISESKSNVAENVEPPITEASSPKEYGKNLGQDINTNLPESTPVPNDSEATENKNKSINSLGGRKTVNEKPFTLPSQPVSNQVYNTSKSSNQNTSLSPLKPIQVSAINNNHANLKSHETGLKPNNTFSSFPKAEPGNRFFSRFTIAAYAGPEFTSAGMTGAKSYSTLVGARIGFEITPHITFSSGILYSNKKYDTPADAYEPPEGYWDYRTNGVLPSKIEGSCRVIDIPVNLTYHARWIRNHRYSVTAGLSNFILLNEYYDFEYSEENPGADEGWWTDENAQAKWSIANIGLGYEYLLNPQISVFAEPYIKIPLKKMGWGNVELSSIGVKCGIQIRMAK